MFVLFVVCVVLWHFVLCVLCVFCVVSSRDCAPLVLLCFFIVRGIGLESGLGLVGMRMPVRICTLAYIYVGVRAYAFMRVLVTSCQTLTLTLTPPRTKNSDLFYFSIFF